ncbi:MAG: hypothetical protein HYR83_02110 [Planctomycetes bacterium]|nr:hypothetical protein [Planctomycetota bacterium]
MNQLPFAESMIAMASPSEESTIPDELAKAFSDRGNPKKKATAPAIKTRIRLKRIAIPSSIREFHKRDPSRSEIRLCYVTSSPDVTKSEKQMISARIACLW